MAARLLPAQIVLLGKMEAREGEQLLGHWLASARRGLQLEQRTALVAAFAGKGKPLHVRTRLEEARRVA